MVKTGGGGVAVVFIDILLSLLVASGGAIQYFLSCWGWCITMHLYSFCLSVGGDHLCFSCVGYFNMDKPSLGSKV